MMFNVHKDQRHRLEGYFVPNGFTGKARIRVTGEGRVLYAGECEEVVEDLVRVGRHQTGLASFSLDNSKIEGLSEIDDLCIYDDDSDFLIYRRNLPNTYLQRRVFRLETALVATAPYASALMPHFAYGVTEAHLQDQETISQLFNLRNYPSMYFEGRVHIKPHLRYLDDRIFSVVSIHDPFVALAMTLDGMCQGAGLTPDRLEEREYSALLPLAYYFSDIDMGHPEAIRRHLMSAPKSIIRGLEAPLVGLLTGQTPGVGGGRRDIPGALEALSLFDLVISEPAKDESFKTFATSLGLNSSIFPGRTLPPRVFRIVEAIRDLPMLETALESDLVVHHCLLEARVRGQSA